MNRNLQSNWMRKVVVESCPEVETRACVFPLVSRKVDDDGVCIMIRAVFEKILWLGETSVRDACYRRVWGLLSKSRRRIRGLEDEYLAPAEGDFGNEEGGLQDDRVIEELRCFPQNHGCFWENQLAEFWTFWVSRLPEMVVIPSWQLEMKDSITADWNLFVVLNQNESTPKFLSFKN